MGKKLIFIQKSLAFLIKKSNFAPDKNFYKSKKERILWKKGLRYSLPVFL